MDNADLTRIALMSPDQREAAVDRLVAALLQDGFEEADLADLERRVRQVNAALGAPSALH